MLPVINNKKNSKMKVSISCVKEFEIEHIKNANDGKHEIIWIEESLNKNNVDKVDGSEAHISFTTDDLNAEVLDKLKDTGIKYIATRSAGTDHIDVEHAKEIGIRVANAPRYSPNAIAEHAVGMLLTLSRKFIEADEKISHENFDLTGLIGFELNNKTAGILGTGKIGATSVKILNGFGCKILMYDKIEQEELEEKYDARYVEMDRILKEADFIFIHLPLNEKTRHLIDKESIKKMKDGVILINVGRGAIINTKNLIEGLKSEKIAKAGLDVYEKEQGLFFDDHSDEPLKDEDFAYLQANNNVLITGHQAFATEKAIKSLAETTFENLNDWEKGEEPENQL
jgi:D-lactate dehydrogenase